MNVFSFTNKHIAARIVAAVALFGLLASLVPMQTFAQQPSDPNTELIEICHATGSHNKPYEQPNPSDTAKTFNGHGDHDGPVWYPGIEVKWGDIIPPFTWYEKVGVGQNVTWEARQFDGLNWTTEGQAIWNNECTAPTDTRTTSLTLTKKVANGGPAVAADWTLSAQGPQGFSGAGTASRTFTSEEFDGIAVPTWDLIESPTVVSSTTDNYVAGTWSCTGNSIALAGNQITLAKGESVSCEVTNTYEETTTPETCVDGIQNQNETGIDTGGVCGGGDPTPTPCSLEIVSDTNTYVVEKDANALALTYVHPAWTASIPGATWIWGDNPVVVSASNETQTFVNQFGFVGTVATATLYVASDNSHVTQINASAAGASAADNNFQLGTQKQYDVTGLIDQGNNELSVAVTNKGPVTDPAANPAGVRYKLLIEGYVTSDADCAVPYEEPVDLCLNVEGFQNSVPEGLVRDEGGNCNVPVVPACDYGFGPDNLLSNASFEEPTVTAHGGQWEIFAAVSNWIISLSDGLELWRGIGIGASDGEQNAELDGNDATKITQTVLTEVGAAYELRFDFAARTANAADNYIEAAANGVPLITASTSNTNWTTYTQTFVADSASTDISFEDLGTPQEGGGTGTLLDNAVLCKVRDAVVEDDTYLIYGYVWHDNNRNQNWDGRANEEQQSEDATEEDEEASLAGWTVRITNGTDEYSTTTDEFGYYEFEVPAGTWTITEEVQNGWERTTQESHVVTVPVAPVVTIVDHIFNFFIPTAHAAVVDSVGEFNFGNDEVRGGGGGGSFLPPTSRTPAVRGERTDGTPAPQPQVLGEQVSVVPAGAPDAGAGGTSPVPFNFGTIGVAAFLGRSRRNG